MIKFEEALNLVLEHTPTLTPTEKSIYEVNSEILAEDIKAKVDMPIFTNSAMDGYALRFADTDQAPVELNIKGCIKAGDFPRRKLMSGEAVKIMTGAPLPEGADAVVMKEDSEEKSKKVLIKISAKKGEHVRFKGEEIQRNKTVLRKGTKLNPASVGFLAAIGQEKIQVFPKPKVSVLVTGNELVKPGRELKPGKIWESNTAILNALLKELDIEPIFLGIARDKLQDLQKRIQSGLHTSDILLICGGISVGDYDLVQTVLLKLKIKKIFWRVAMKPGKPVFFGKKGKKLIYGLPGNPASVLVSFLEFVRPSILKMASHKNIFLQERTAILKEGLQKKVGRAHFLRGVIHRKNDITYVKSAGLQNSHMLESFARADCLIYLEKEKHSFSPGERVKIQILPWK